MALSITIDCEDGEALIICNDTAVRAVYSEDGVAFEDFTKLGEPEVERALKTFCKAVLPLLE